MNKICRVSDLKGSVINFFSVKGENKTVEIIVINYKGSVLIYENKCPHKGMTLGYLQEFIFDSAHQTLKCGRHGAKFDLNNGYCFFGPCKDSYLNQINYYQSGEYLYIETSHLL